MAEPIRLLIVDDHAVVRRGLRLFLELQPGIEVVGEAENGRAAVERAIELSPDVVLMDVVMGELDGIEATRALRERAPASRVLVLSSFGDDDRVLPALRAGALGYLLKDTEPDKLTEAIRAVHRGEPVLCREAIDRLVGTLSHSRRRPEGTVTLLLTDIEGSTALLEELGEQPARELFREHDGIVRAAVGRNDGVEVEHEGDAFLIAFSSARQAVACAADVQRELHTQPGRAVRIRIGLNTGDVVTEGDRYFGRAVFLASRVAAAAAGGEILVSELTQTLATDCGLSFRDRGLHKLKGLKGSHRLFAVEWKPA